MSRRDIMNRLLIKKQAKASLKGKWGKAIGLCLVGTILMMIVPMIFYVIGLATSTTKEVAGQVEVTKTSPVGLIFFILAMVAIFIIVPLFAYALTKAFMSANRGGDFKVGDIFDGFKEKPGKTLGTGILSAIIIFLCHFIPAAIGGIFIGTVVSRIQVIADSIKNLDLDVGESIAFITKNTVPRFSVALLFFVLAVVLGTIAKYMLKMIYYVRVDNPDASVVEILKTSRKIMHGRKIDLFVLSFSFIGWDIVCYITCGIGYLWLIPYMSAAEAAFYDAAKDDIIE